MEMLSRSVAFLLSVKVSVFMRVERLKTSNKKSAFQREQENCAVGKVTSTDRPEKGSSGL